MRDQLQELRELGVRRTLFRIGWELRLRSGLAIHEPAPRASAAPNAGAELLRLWALPDPPSVALAMRERIPPASLEGLAALADDATRGTILAFGSWPASYGDPPDWHLNPRTGARWREHTHWSAAMADEARVGDVKLTWEIGRFPHAYHLARAAAFHPDREAGWASALSAQLGDFVAKNPVGRGVHWGSGQETAIRLFAWLFSLDTLLARSSSASRDADLVARALVEGAAHVERHIAYARHAVYNNHLIADALCLYAAALLVPSAEHAARWERTARDTLTEEADRQVYSDGGYIQLSHTYERAALQYFMWAVLLARAAGRRVSASWLSAMDRAIAFLVAHQCPSNGWLPNFGANDGTLPHVLSTAQFADFRPTLQAASLLVRGERLYDAGPWDEEAAWLAGPASLDGPLRAPVRRTISFPQSGFHVLRGDDARTFASFRCGTVHDRFSQIDMLHLDLFWRGENVLTDGGSYLYNGAPEWHAHFLQTASHNTVVVDGREQMLHFRRFKLLYRTRAELVRLDEGDRFAHVVGRHFGYRRHPGGVVHERSVLFAKDDLLVVVDSLSGDGAHEARLHWLGGPYAWSYDAVTATLRLDTAAGEFGVATFDASGAPLAGTVVAGSESPPRGWVARHYGEKVAAPSLAVEARGELPLHLVSVLGAGAPRLARDGARFVASAGGVALRFGLAGGRFVAPERVSTPPEDAR